MNNSSLIILTFIITGIWDLVLQFMSYNYNKLPKFIQWFEDPKILQPYFKKHTLLSAVLLAGFSGAVAQIILLLIFKTYPKNIKSFIPFTILTFFVSGIVGLLMQYSQLYPILNETYYKKLGKITGFYHDGVSGLIVQITLFVLLNASKLFK